MAFAHSTHDHEWEAMYDIPALLGKNRIIEVARELGLSVNRSTVPCLHQERHRQGGFPTMTFNLLNNTFKCWVCSDVGGNVIDLVQQVKGIDRRAAIEYLAIRVRVLAKPAIAAPGNGHAYQPGNGAGLPSLMDAVETPSNIPEPMEKESVFAQFLDGLNTDGLVDLLAFVSLKGGTGKSLIVNNLAAAYGLLTRYIAQETGEEVQEVELIDLDFGKPDQRLLCGLEPERYLEDIFYHRKEGIGWDTIRRRLPLEPLYLISTSPARRSANLFYLHKNEMIYLVNDSPAKIKLADFGGGINKDILDFLNNIRSKICVINGEKTSQEAIFYLILAITLDQMRKVFANDKEVDPFLEKLRECRRNGFRVSDLQFELERLDGKRRAMQNLNAFFRNRVEPLKRKLGLMDGDGAIEDPDQLRQEVIDLQAAVHAQLFRQSDGREKDFDQKLKLYRDLNQVTEEARNFESLSERFRQILQNNRYGLIVNKADAAVSREIQAEVNRMVSGYLGQPMRYLGNVREDPSMRNVSNNGMPLLLSHPDLPSVQEICAIADNLMGLKAGSMRTIIADQQDYIANLRRHWTAGKSHMTVAAMPAAVQA